SVGPYGAFLADGSEYRGDYQRSAAEFQAFHRPRVEALLDAGANHLSLTHRTKPTILSRFCSKNDSLLARIFNYFISILMPE
ncbi:homocysteine S-methyltransferase family protein, partial [Klebsiella pneumoniae]|uniref:homocysteine S-methyltransferase family protein n=1 Tax=Klebsiella pneumoniae TaxID=573 RepID=UPI0023814A03